MAGVQRAYERLNAAHRDAVVVEMVRYIVVATRRTNAVKKAALKEHVLGKRTENKDLWLAFNQLLERADQRLQRTFGLSVSLNDTNDVKLYVRNLVTNSVEPQREDTDDPHTSTAALLPNSRAPDAMLNGVMCAALGCVFMSGGEMPREELSAFLSELGVRRGDRNVALGLTQEEFIKKMEQKGYIQGFAGRATVDGQVRELVQWGFLARSTVSRVAVLEMVCRLYADGRRVEDMPDFQRMAREADAAELCGEAQRDEG